MPFLTSIQSYLISAELKQFTRLIMFSIFFWAYSILVLGFCGVDYFQEKKCQKRNKGEKTGNTLHYYLKKRKFFFY